jgi:hypothetical protein
MKYKITTFLLLLTSLSYGQNYGFEETENFLIPLLVGFVLIVVIIILASFLESKKHTLALYTYKNQGYLMLIPLFSFIGTFILFLVMINYKNLSEITQVGFVLKFIMAFFTAFRAEKLGRNVVLWFLLGFLEYHTALIILAIRPAVIRVDKENEKIVIELNKNFKLKDNDLTDLYHSNLLTMNEFIEKISEVRKNYFIELEKIVNKDSEIKSSVKKDEDVKKLVKAFEDGLLTQEEFDKKFIEFNNNANN